MHVRSLCVLFTALALLAIGCSDDDEGQIPDAPTGLTATLIRSPSISILLEWQATEHADDYCLERSDNGVSWGTILVTSNTGCTDDNVEPGVSYRYRVQGENWDAGKGDYSNTVSVVVALPPPPENIVVTPGPDCIVLTWDEVDNASWYVIRRADLSSMDPSYIDLDERVYEYDLPYRDCDEIVPGHQYSYRISTEEPGFGEGDYASVSTTASDVEPPTGLSASDGTSSNSVSLSWTGQDYADSYIVLRALLNGGPWDTIATSETGTSLLDQGVNPGVLYFYAVVTNLGDEQSPLSDTDSGYAGTLPTDAPAAPETPTFSSGTVSWQAVSGATEYRVYRRDSLGVDYEALSGWQTDLSYTDQSMSDGVVYHYVVAARNDYGESDLSAPVYGLNGSEPPLGPPATMSLISAGPDETVVTWTAVSGALSYELQRCYKSNTGYLAWQSVATDLDTLTFGDSQGIDPGDTIGYRVAANSLYLGRGNWSDILEVVLDTSDTNSSGPSDSMLVDTAFRFMIYGTAACTEFDTSNTTDYRPLMVSYTHSPDSTVVRKNWEYVALDSIPPKPYTLTDSLEFFDHPDSTTSYRLTGILSRESTYEPDEATQSRIVTAITGTLSLTGGTYSEVRYDLVETQTTFQPGGNWEIRYTGTIYYDDEPVVVDDYAPVATSG